MTNALIRINLCIILTFPLKSFHRIKFSLMVCNLTRQMKTFTTVILYFHLTLYHIICMSMNCRMVDLSVVKVTFWLYNIVLWSMSLGHMKPAFSTLWLTVCLSLLLLQILSLSLIIELENMYCIILLYLGT